MSIYLFTNNDKEQLEEKTETAAAASLANAHLVVFEDEAIQSIKHLEALAEKYKSGSIGFLPDVPTRLIEDDIEKLLRFMLNDKASYIDKHKTCVVISDRKIVGNYLLEVGATMDTNGKISDRHIYIKTYHLNSPYRSNIPIEKFFDMYYNIGGPDDLLSERMINLLKEYHITPEMIKKEEKPKELESSFKIVVTSINGECNKTRGPYKTLERARAAAMRWKDKVDDFGFPYFLVYVYDGSKEVETIRLSEFCQ